MKTQNTATNEIERIGVGTDRAFGIKFDAKMAKILADGLYSDKIKSVIRELGANAYDSHVEAGKIDVPFEVHLPNTLEPWFSVKDFGVGLSDQQILDIYTCYGISTKTESNEVVGQLGLGSKSPFSLSDVFNVSARKNGVENHYSMYKDETGMPSVAHLGSNATTEPNGLTVKVPVRNEQRSDFINKSAGVFRWFPTAPVFVNATKNDNMIINDHMKKHTSEFNGTGWEVALNGYSYAVMGIVAYPLRANNIPGLSPIHKALLQTGTILHFNIGDLEVTANREDIGYDDRTCANIIDKLNLLITEITAQVESKFKSAATKWEADILFNKIFGYHGNYSYVLNALFRRSGINWNGILVDGAIKVNIADFYDLDPVSKKVINPPGCIHSHTLRADYDVYCHTLIIPCKNNVTIVFNDLPKKGGIARIYNYYRNKSININKHDNEIWIFSPSSKCTWDVMKSLLGNPPVVFTSSLPKVDTPTTVKAKVLKWQPLRLDQGIQREWQTSTIDIEAGGFYVDLNGWELRMFGKKVNHRAMFEIVLNAEQASIVPQNVAVYAMRDALKDKVKNNPKWVELFGYIKEETIKQATSLSIMQIIADSDAYNTIVHSSDYWAPWLYTLEILDKTSPMQSYIDCMNKVLKTGKSLASKSRALHALCSALNVGITATSDNIIRMSNEINARYPMLVLLKRNTNPIAVDVKRGEDYINFVDATDAEFRKGNLKTV